jgi:hypothetical protein
MFVLNIKFLPSVLLLDSMKNAICSSTSKLTNTFCEVIYIAPQICITAMSIHLQHQLKVLGSYIPNIKIDAPVNYQLRRIYTMLLPAILSVSGIHYYASIQKPMIHNANTAPPQTLACPPY